MKADHQTITPKKPLAESNGQNHYEKAALTPNMNVTEMGAVNSENSSRPTTPNGKKPFLIGVTGGTASGKTSVCEDIIAQVKEDPQLSSASVAIMSQDYFYQPLNDQQLAQAHEGNFNFDHPHAFDFQLFYNILKELATGKPVVQVPTYCYVTHSRTGWKDFSNADVIIVEGILVLYQEEIRNMFEMKIFVDADADTRLARRVFRDIEERGRSVDTVLHQYCEHVKPAFEEFCRPTKKYVDVILPRGRENIVAVNLIAQHVHDLLSGLIDSRMRRTSNVNSSSSSVCEMGISMVHKKMEDMTIGKPSIDSTKPTMTRPH